MHRPWYRRARVLAPLAGVLGLFFGLGIGSLLGAPEDSAEYQALTEDLERARGDLADSEEELSTSDTERVNAQDELRSLRATIEGREATVEEAREDLASDAAKLNSRRRAVKRAEASVGRRERAVRRAEGRVAASTIPGDGVFRVGADMEPGTYRSNGRANCYYAVNGDANGNNILSNNITSGPAVVSVSVGEFLETQGCADWVIQR